MPSDSLRNLRDRGQELYELGPKGSAVRVMWELSRIGRFTGRTDLPPDAAAARKPSSNFWVAHLPFSDPISVAEAVRDRIPPDDLHRLLMTADRALPGDIECFGRWHASFGEPIEWHRNPLNGEMWPADIPSRRALWGNVRAGDVKLCWEVARFPHAYHMARCAAFLPETAPRFARAMNRMIRDFLIANKPGYGIHWASSEDVAFRLLAWMFCADALLTRSEANVAALLRDALLTGAAHIEKNIDRERILVDNSHLLSEALALFAVGALLPEVPVARRWRDMGRAILEEESETKFCPEGAYLEQSHNNHRTALYDLLWACLFAKSMGDRPSAQWLEAIERSIAFLVAHQNPENGRLPNYGSNDGGMPGIFSTCDFADFRPVLQTANVLVHGKRLYEPGPWDEMVAWFLGSAALDTPIEPPRRRSLSFAHTGHHVLRGRDEHSFAAFRCGTLLDRFSQIDMLHLDVWWRGHNVLADAGSYLYHDEPEWHQHFMRTGCHNTMTIDGLDQMLHVRQFKVLYRTHARPLQFDESIDWLACAGEHYGYQRHPGGCVHSRSVVFLKDDLWVVVDHVTGSGSHALRLHWLGGDFPYTFDPHDSRLALETEDGHFFVQVLDTRGRPIAGDVVAGQEKPPRGWLSRYYGEKIAVPSFAVTAERDLPVTFVSVLSGGSKASAIVDGAAWSIVMGDRRLRFRLADGRVTVQGTDRNPS
jgi:asparagine synthase (glutamine-hydrolysing)